MPAGQTSVLPAAQAARRLAADRDLLLDAVRAQGEDRLAAPYLAHGGPLGDFCDSLHDLVAHVLMWDEINLAVLAEAQRGRVHWSVDPRWEDPQTGATLNRSGVAAGRELPAALLMHRFAATRQALHAELIRCGGHWLEPTPDGHGPAASLGALAQHVMTVPGKAPYWHAAIHLGRAGKEAV